MIARSEPYRTDRHFDRDGYARVARDGHAEFTLDPPFFAHDRSPELEKIFPKVDGTP